MEFDEKVMALKKAYADIILNTAKEAATRVMMSERKAQRFEHELKVAKEEGLRMLLRIKQMLDAKVSEAELTALSQKKKIDELEAQLHEAEDIVRDLREELRDVQSELERVKIDKAQCREKSYIPTHGQLAEFRPQELYGGSIFSQTMVHAFNDQRNAAQNSYRTSIYRGYSNGGSPDLPSIISRRKEPLFYRNGCTQRIRACEKARLDQEFSLSTSINKTKDEISIKEDEGGKETCNLQRQENENRKTSKQKVNKENLNLDLSLINKRNGASSQLMKESISPRNVSGESTRTDQAPLCLRPNSTSDDAHSSDNLSRKAELSMHPVCAGNSGSGGKLVNCSTDQGRENRHSRVTTEMAPQNMEREGCPDIMDAAKGSPLPIELEPNESENGISLPKPTFKYTFQRKRKRDSFVNGNESLENNLPEEYVPVESNKRLDENCDLENITPQGNGTPKKRTSDTITDPGKSSLSTGVSEEQSASINLPKSACVIESPQDSLALQ